MVTSVISVSWIKVEHESSALQKKDDITQKNKIDEELERRSMNQQMIVDQQEHDINVRT